MVLCFEKLLWFMGLGPPLHGQFLILKIKMEKKKWWVSKLIIKSEDLISYKSILWETATHQCQLCLLLESIIFLKSYLILWKCNLYNIKCKQTFPEKTRFSKRDYHFRMEVVFFFQNLNPKKSMILRIFRQNVNKNYNYLTKSWEKLGNFPKKAN